MKLRWSLLSTAAFSAITLVPIARAQVEARASLPPADEAVPEGLTASDWSIIRAAYDAHRCAVVECEDGHRARNFHQQWTTLFDGRGFTTTPHEGAWTWGLDLVRYGWGEQQQTVRMPRTVTSCGERVAYVWNDQLTEWYVNDRRGLEHGYTVQGRPPRDEATSHPEPLTLTLAVRGGLDAEVHDDGRGVSFADGGRSVLTYTGLTVIDASGHRLPARLEQVGEGLRLSVDERDACYPLTIDPIAQQAYLKASNTGQSDNFGYATAISGDTVVVGADGEDSNAAGVNGDQSNNGAPSAGAVYVFVRSGTSWIQEAYLKASNSEANDLFGQSVSISGDTVVVGAPMEDSGATGVDGDQGNSVFSSGAAYVFVRSGTVWSQQAYLKASNTGASDQFGRSVSVSGDTLIVGAPGESSNATGVDGNQSNNSAPAAGAGYVFARSGTTWSQEAYLKASNTGVIEGFGSSVSVDVNTIVIGSPSEDSNATGVNGDQMDDSAADSGAAYVFFRSGGSWSQQAYLKASNTDGANGGPQGDIFGSRVAVSGDTIVVGAPNEDSDATGIDGNQASNSAADSGAAYVFFRTEDAWAQQAYLKASNTDAGDGFGRGLGVAGEAIVIGASGEDSNAAGVDGYQGNSSAIDSGATYLFVRDGGAWAQQAYLKASNTNTGDAFGLSPSISEDTVIVGAPGEDSDATGVNGDEGNASLNSGAAYVFAVNASLRSFCDSSDGSLAICPCANPGNPDTGCDSAQANGGVGVAVVSQTTSPNGATLSGTGFSTMGSPTALVIRSSGLEVAAAFGDGVECLDFGSLVRLAATLASGGTSMHAFTHGTMAGSGTFYYQIWYRNTPSSYCTPAAFNLSSGRALVW